MLRFDVYRDGKLASQIDLTGAYIFGQDNIPVRADLAASNGQISCMKHAPGACGLALLWHAGSSGTFMLPTTRLPERGEPYNLNVEIARGQIMRLAQKREDWGLFDYVGAESLNKEFDEVRRKFARSLKPADPAEAAALADQALEQTVTLGEKAALFHADIFLTRRRAPAAAKATFGCEIDLAQTADNYRTRVREMCDFVSIPLPWKQIEPKERQYDYTAADNWIKWGVQHKKPIHSGPLLSFDPATVPEWLYIWENDFDSLRELVFEHASRIVQRYSKQVQVWNVVSGIHAHNAFNLNFEQLMELTRMTCLLVKKMAPRSQVMIELVLPWGEYYARNQRTIPPMLYADMAVQSGVKFDSFGLQMFMGVAMDGFCVRDFMQISALLDEFISLSKPVHVTACGVPSDITADPADAWEGKESIVRAGQWHAPWSQRLQAEWLQAFFRVSLSKPFVESLCWRDLSDTTPHYIPHGGLCHDPAEPKLACRELRNFRNNFLAGQRGPAPAAPAPSDEHP